MTRAASFRLGRREPTGSLPGCRPRPPRTRLPRARPPRGRRRRPCRVSPSSSTPRSPPSAARGATARTRWPRPSGRRSRPASTWPCRRAPAPASRWPTSCPAIRHAVERGTTVVVSTATIALQRQLVDRDLPRLAKALTPLLGRAPTFAILKGRRNYLCLNKLHGNGDDVDEDEQLFDPFAVSALGRTVKRIHEWAATPRPATATSSSPACPSRRGGRCRSAPASAWAPSRCPVGDDCFAEKARAPRPGGRTSSSPTTRCSPSTRSRAARCCPSTTWWSSTRRTSWSTGSPAWRPRS